MKYCVIFNPTARGEKAQRFHASLASVAARAALKPTTARGAGRTLAAQAVREGFDVIVAAGGDGTLNEVLNGIGDVPDGFSRTRLGVLPLGTINVFARELGLPTSVEDAWRVIESGKELAIDLPLVEFMEGSSTGHLHFAQLAGAGLDSQAIQAVDLEQKKQIGPLAYVVAGLKVMGEAKSPILATAKNHSAIGELVLIGNGRYYGGSFEVFPQADLQDGLLDVTVFPKVDWPLLVKAGWGLLTGQLHASTRCLNFQAPSVRLSCANKTPFELDGDNAGLLPAHFSLRRGALRVLVP